MTRRYRSSRWNRLPWNRIPPYRSCPGSRATGGNPAGAIGRGVVAPSVSGTPQRSVARKWSAANPVSSERTVRSTVSGPVTTAATRTVVPPPRGTTIGRTNAADSNAGTPSRPVSAAATCAIASIPNTMPDAFA